VEAKMAVQTKTLIALQDELASLKSQRNIDITQLQGMQEELLKEIEALKFGNHHHALCILGKVFSSWMAGMMRGCILNMRLNLQEHKESQLKGSASSQIAAYEKKLEHARLKSETVSKEAIEAASTVEAKMTVQTKELIALQVHHDLYASWHRWRETATQMRHQRERARGAVCRMRERHLSRACRQWHTSACQMTREKAVLHRAEDRAWFAGGCAEQVGRCVCHLPPRGKAAHADSTQGCPPSHWAQEIPRSLVHVATPLL